MRRDIQYALRAFAKNPVFTLIIVITIALGVGPNSAVFSIINAVLLRPLPYHEPERLVMLWETNKKRGFDQMPVSGPNYVDWKSQSRSFESMAPAFTIPEYRLNIAPGGDPECAQGGQAHGDLFRVLGVNPVIGRTFNAAEDAPGGPRVMLVSHSFWKRRFGSAPGILGRAFTVDGVSRTVVGVLPPEVESLGKVDLWLPIARNFATQQRNSQNYGVMARLKPGVTPAQAQAEMDTIAKRLEQQYPEANRDMGALVVPISELLAGRIRPALIILLGAVGFLLLIACANVAGLLLARGASRQKEIAVRVAVGASRARIVRQLLTESVFLGAAGGTLGLLLSTWSIQALRSQLPDVIPRLKEMGVDLRVLAFGIVISILTGIVFGLVPALRTSKTDFNETLKEGGGKGAAGDTGQRLRMVLLTGEVALAVVLLVGAGLLVRSFVHVISTDPGFQSDNLLTMQLTLPRAKYPSGKESVTFVRNALRRIEAIPGVEAAAEVSILPARGSLITLRTFVTPFRIDGEPVAQAGREPIADYRSVTPGFFKAMGIPLRAGRLINDQDLADKQHVVLINETMARRYLRGRDPLGALVRFPPFDTNVKVVAGVVGDVAMQGVERPVEPAVYVPFEQSPNTMFSMVIRSSKDPSSLASAVRREVIAVDPDQPIADVRTMNEVLGDSLLVRRLSVWMLGIFAGLALLLAAVGVYGLTAYSVSRRTHEIGLRLAMGAPAKDILRLVLWRGIATSLAGIAIGVPAAFALSRAMASMLFGVTPTDPITYVVVPLLLVVAAAAACYVPARRAMRVDPILALRYE